MRSTTCCFSLFDRRVQAVISSLVLLHPLQTPNRLSVQTPVHGLATSTLDSSFSNLTAGIATGQISQTPALQASI